MRIGSDLFRSKSVSGPTLRVGFMILITGLFFVAGESPICHAQEADAEVAESDEAEIDPAMLQAMQTYAKIEWTSGPADVDVGSNATIHIPEGFKLTGKEGSQLWNEVTQNPPDETIATLMPESEDWFAAFSFDEIGYVKDDEKADLDADAIFKSMSEGTEASNEYRRQQGWGGIHMDSWIVEPQYDDATKHLVWAFRLRDDDGGTNANYSMRLLGRRGVMNVLVVAGEDTMQDAVDATNGVLEGFDYKPGHRYAEFTSGDKIAEYGLTALIAGGGLVAAAKTGLLAKLGKFIKVIVIGVIALGSWVWKLITGQSRSEAT